MSEKQTREIMVPSMPEMAHAGEDHGYPVLIGGLDDLLVTDAAPRLDDGGHPGFSSRINTVPEGKEGIRGQHRPFDGQQRFLDSDA